MKSKKLPLFVAAIFSAFMGLSQSGQNPLIPCGNTAPPQQWEAWMQEKIAEYKASQSSQRLVSTVIPVVVHVIHFGEALGVFPNVDSNQVKSQIAVLNNDFAGTGLGANTPNPFSNLKSNTGISFCLAAKDPLDNALPEKGIHRVSAAANSWLSPATPTLDLKNYMKTIIIPATIWDPTKYLNIWISDKPQNYPMNGFATYPAGSGLSGLFGTDFSSTNFDGIWVWTKAFGTVGTQQAPYDKGRTATHELGHYFGLRHIWGDGNCLSDYVNDTPWHKQAHTGCVSSTPPDQCGVNSAPLGEMPMNFMDMSDDQCMWMFTHEQNTRMQIALSQSPYRNALGTHGKCLTPTGVTTSSAVAGFTLGTTQCLGQPFYPFNTSSGYPSPTFLWSSTPAANFGPNTSVANPGITLTNPGTYTISLAATNSLSSSSYSMVITAYATCPQLSPCIDTLKAITTSDTLRSLKLSQIPNPGSCSGGYLAGTNCYKDKEFAQFFSPATYSGTPNPQVNSVIVLFDSLGTNFQNSGTIITCKLYGGNVTQGPVSLMGQVNETLGNIVGTTKVQNIGYLGKPNQPPVNLTKIIPYKYNFATPLVINSTSGFFAAVQTATNSLMDSINIMTNSRYNAAVDSSAWFLQFTNSWKTFRSGRGMKIQLAIMPQITCSQGNGIEESSINLANSVMVMPNPGTGKFNVVFTLSKQQDIGLHVYNATGQQILDSRLGNVMNNVVEVDLTGYPDGIYFAEVDGQEGRTVKKIILTH